MNRYRWVFFLSLLLLAGTISPASAWFRVGFRGPRVGVYLGPGPYWWGYPYDPYYEPYYDPYYDYSYGAPPVYAPVESEYPPSQESDQDNTRHSLEYLNDHIARARDFVDYEYSDGDISKAEHNAEIHRLYLIERTARSEAKINGGYLTTEQQNDLLLQLHSGAQPVETPSAPESRTSIVNSRNGIQPTINRIAQLRKLLDKKLADADITKAQHDGMAAYLDRIDKQVRSDASANEGRLTPDQESAVRQQLQRAEDSITKNFVVN